MLLRLALALPLLAGFSLTACTTTIVKKPEADLVSKIAVISVYADPVFKSADGESATAKASGWANTLGLNGDNDKQAGKVLSLDAGGTRLVEDALRQYTAAFGHVRGWQVVDAQTFVQKPFFRDFVQHEDDRYKKMMGVMAGLSPHPYVKAAGLPAVMPLANDKDEEAAALKQLAKDIGCDSVAVVSLAFSFRGSTTVGGNGTATLVEATSVTVYNRNGAKAVAGSFRQNSEETVAMVMNSIAINEKSESSYQGLTKKTASLVVDKINAEL